jgi:hypothetical protein
VLSGLAARSMHRVLPAVPARAVTEPPSLPVHSIPSCSFQHSTSLMDEPQNRGKIAAAASLQRQYVADAVVAEKRENRSLLSARWRSVAAWSGGRPTIEVNYSRPDAGLPRISASRDGMPGLWRQAASCFGRSMSSAFVNAIAQVWSILCGLRQKNKAFHMALSR